MTNALEPSSLPVVTPDQHALITRTIAPDATPDELKLYLFDCARHGVHPLDKLLHFTKRKGKYTPITSIDLMRIRAAETGECLGISDAIFTGTIGVYPAAATITVRRLVGGQVAEFTATARWPEYYPGDGEPGFMWRRMPHTMLSKCCEALALRKGFPKQLSGLYAKEEFDQADGTILPPGDSTPAADDRRITKAQQRRLFAQAKAHGWTTEQFRAALFDTFAVRKSTELRARVFDRVLARIAQGPAGTEADSREDSST
jgi:phage recombination protein Bet